MGPKKKGRAARSRYMIADFTPEERERIIEFCKRNGATVSSFLAELALEDVYRASREEPGEEEFTITLKIPAEQSAKLYMFSHRRGQTINQYVGEIVTPVLEKGKTSFTAKTQTLRYYVSPKEHQLLKKYLKSRNLSARTYVSYLALRALEQRRKK